MAIAERLLQLPVVGDLRTDRQLVRAAQSGDTGAASVLIERYYPKVFSFVSYMGANGASEDITQEVFARALSALPRFNGKYRVGSWLMRIAKNLLIDESRRKGFRPEPVDPSDLIDLDQDHPGDNVWESVSQQLVGSVVRQALKSLPARQRAALVLREIEGMSYAEIAQVIGTNLRGAEATLRRARERFRVEVVRAEGLEADRASCRRVLRLLAKEEKTPSLEVARHLKACPDCRRGSATVRGADKLFGSLPPLALGDLAWRSEVLGLLKPRARRPRGLMESLRGHAEVGFASPLAQMGEIVASFAIAATVSVASVTGVAQRVIVVQPAVVEVEAEVEPEAAVATSESPLQPAAAAPPDLQPAAPHTATAAPPGGSGQTELSEMVAVPASLSVAAVVSTVEELEEVITVQTTSLQSLLTAGLETTTNTGIEDTLPLEQTTGVLTAPIGTPRRRPHPW